MAAATGSVAIWRPHVTAFHRTRASQEAPCLKWRLQASRFLSMGPSVLVSSQNGYPSPRQPGMYPYTPRNLQVDVPPQPCDGTWMAIIKAHGIRGPCQHSTAQQELIAWILRGNIGFYGLPQSRLPWEQKQACGQYPAPLSGHRSLVASWPP